MGKKIGETYSQLGDSVRDWYMEAFPTDDMGEDINPNVTFSGVVLQLANGHGEDIYEYIGAGDSIIRERIFEELSGILGVDYDVVYYAWLGRDTDTLSKALLNKNAKSLRKRAMRKTASDDGWSIFIGAVLAPACGKWVELPCDDSEIDEAIEYACSEYEKYEGEPIEETMIPDYEGYFGMTAAEMEYADPHELNAMVQSFVDSGLPQAVIEAAMECGYSTDDLDDIWYVEANDDTDLAYVVIDEMGGVEQLDRDTIERYFDYEAYGRDLSFEFYQGDGYYIHTGASKQGKKYLWGFKKHALSFDELTEDQLQELAQAYLVELANDGMYADVMGVDWDEPSWGEMANALDIVTKDVLRDRYNGYLFVPDDFSCSMASRKAKMSARRMRPQSMFGSRKRMSRQRPVRMASAKRRMRNR